MARLEAATPAAGGGGTRTRYPAGRGAPPRTRLPAAQPLRVVRQWAQAVRAGQGTLHLGDERCRTATTPAAATMDAAPVTRPRRRAAPREERGRRLGNRVAW